MGWDADFSKRAQNGELTVGIIGLGYVGLPTAVGFYDAGFNVWGVDISERTVRMVLAGENPTGDPDVDDIIPDPNSPRWHITTSTSEAVPHCDVVLVTVPTPVTEELKPDLTYVIDAGRSVFESIVKGTRTIVVLESTVYPGVTAQTWLPLIDELCLEIGKDVEIAYCPERFNPGDPAHGVRQVARVVGCSNSYVGEDLVALYRRLTSEDVRYVGKLEVAEAAKVIENVQRDINIALVNELARIFPELGVDVEDVLDAHPDGLFGRQLTALFRQFDTFLRRRIGIERHQQRRHRQTRRRESGSLRCRGVGRAVRPFGSMVRHAPWHAAPRRRGRGTQRLARRPQHRAAPPPCIDAGAARAPGRGIFTSAP